MRRAAVWTDGDVIQAPDIVDALITTVTDQQGADTFKRIGDGIDLNRLLDEIKHRYLSEALEISGGNKSQAARLLGLRSPQVLTNWLRKLEG